MDVSQFAQAALARAQAAVAEARMNSAIETAMQEDAEAREAQAVVIEEALEHAGISGVDVQIDTSNFATVTGQVGSEEEQQTAIAILEQFDLGGMQADLQIVANEVEEADQTSVWADASVPVVYTAVKGDSWWGISKRYYGDGRKWKGLKRANGWPRMLHPGHEVTIPPEDQLPAE